MRNVLRITTKTIKRHLHINRFISLQLRYSMVHVLHTWAWDTKNINAAKSEALLQQADHKENLNSELFKEKKMNLVPCFGSIANHNMFITDEGKLIVWGEHDAIKILREYEHEEVSTNEVHCHCMGTSQGVNKKESRQRCKQKGQKKYENKKGE